MTTTKVPSAGEQRQIGRQPGRRLGRRADCRLRNGRAVKTPRPRLHEGELEAQRGNLALMEAVRDGLHEEMHHAGARAVREDEPCRSLVRTIPETGDDLACHVDPHVIRHASPFSETDQDPAVEASSDYVRACSCPMFQERYGRAETRLHLQVRSSRRGSIRDGPP